MSRPPPAAVVSRCVAACVLAALLPSSALAEPYESNPDAAERDPHYAAGKLALNGKDWAEAARRFERAARDNPDNADLQNYLGYTHRKLGQLDAAFRFYRRALELDPRHRGAHEYIGETYLLIGDVAGAERHVAALRSVCLLSCEELEDLEQAIARYRAAPQKR